MADRIVVMNRGAVEQVGTPHDIYLRPGSPFVARFVGQMNFLPAVAAGAGRAALGGVELRVPAADGLAPGTPVTLAIRPEEILVGDAAAGAENRVEGRVRAVRFLGPFTRVTLALPDTAETALECDVSANAIVRVGTLEEALLALALPADALRVFRRP